MENTNLEQPILTEKLHGEDVSQVENLEENLSNSGSNEQKKFFNVEQLGTSNDELLNSKNFRVESGSLSFSNQNSSVQNEVNSTKKEETSQQNLGKFKDAQALFDAYNNLQSDYTKKCQALAQLHKSMQQKSVPTTRSGMPSANIFEEQQTAQTPALSKEQKESVLEEFIFANPNLKDKFLARYFDEINLPQSPKLIGSDRGSSFVLSPQNKPKTLEEAGKIAREILNKQD